MLPILVCLIQISIVAFVAATAAHLFMDRAPQLSARICGFAMFLSALIVLLTIFGVPRPWTLQSSSSRVSNFASKSRPASERQSTEHDSIGHGSFSIQFSAQHIVSEIAKLQTRYRVADSRMAYGFYIFALTIGLVFLARALLGICWLRRLQSARVLADDSTAVVELNKLRQFVGIGHAIQVCESTEVSSPCISWFHPDTIYVPLHFEHWSTEERRATLAHELAHEIRRDPQHRLFADMCLTLVYFHPLMLLLRRQLVFAQELATDRRAAAMLGSLSQYRRGLSMLALRMDSECNQVSLVSVSNNEVIRRIKMLKTTKPQMRRWQEFVSIGAVAFILVFSAAWTATADDTFRVASNKKLAAKVSNQDKTSSAAAPWETLGSQLGYFHVSPRQMVQHPLLKRLYERYEQEFLREVDLQSFGLEAANIKRIQTPAVITLGEIPEADRAANGAAHSLSMGGDAIVVETLEPIAWSSLAKAIPHGLLPPEFLDYVASQLEEFDGSTQMQLFSKSNEKRDDRHMPQLRALWQQVDDCAISIAVSQLDAVVQNLDETNDQFGICSLVELLDSAGLGIHVDDDDSTLTIRACFAVDQSSSSSEVVTKLKSVRGMLTQLGSAALSEGHSKPEDTAQADALQELLTEFELVEFRIIESIEETEIVVAELRTKIDFFQVSSLF